MSKWLREEQQIVCVLWHDGSTSWILATEAFSNQTLLATALQYRNHPFDEWKIDTNSIEKLVEDVDFE